MLYSGDTCVLMDTAPAWPFEVVEHASGNFVLPLFKYLSVSGSFGVALDFLLWKFLFDIWYSSIHVVILLVCSLHVLVDST